jgi:AraC-like DNA-binding protein
MTTAARLLRETDAPLATVARQVGYSSVYAFGRALLTRPPRALGVGAYDGESATNG